MLTIIMREREKGMTRLELTERPVAGSVEELLVRASSRVAMSKNVDSLSGSGFERAVVDGIDCVVKFMGYEHDWLARALGDRDCWALTMWQSGLLDALPECIDHTVLGMSRDSSGTVAALMRDVGPHLLAPGQDALPFEAHRRFIEHMARVHVEFWGFVDTYGLLDPAVRYQALTPETGRRERERGGTDPVPAVLASSWAALRTAAPEAHDLALALATDARPLAIALDEMPATLVHGDWKAGNLGVQPDGRTILLDWGWPGRGAPLVDIGWYLAVNCDRLPESKEAVVGAYRDALETLGIDTAGWFDRQLDLALLGAFLQLGWSKSGAELTWWLPRIVPVARELIGSAG